MKVVQICIGKFHHFDLARELCSAGALGRIYTGYPLWKLKDEGVPKEKIVSHSYLQTSYLGVMRLPWRVPWLERELAYISQLSLARHAARNLEPCDAVVALSGSGLEAGIEQKSRGGKYVCDRGSSHIRFQNQILADEFARWGISYAGIDPRIVSREEAEYAAADLVTVPSEFTRRSFIKHGVPEHKLVAIPYGVNLGRFKKVAQPSQDRFQVLFVGQVSLRKGVPYLIEAFRKFRHPKKSLIIIGAVQPEIRPFLKNLGAEIQVLGPRPQSELKEWMSRSQVLVLPSIEEGLALVQAQAMACGCPVLATRHTGAEDLFEDRKEGFIVPVRDPSALIEKLETLAENPSLRSEMGAACIRRVQLLGGLKDYGARYLAMLRMLVGRS